MAKNAQEPVDPVGDTPPRTWRDAWPFFVALGVVVVAVIGLGLSYVIRPAEDRATDSAKVQYAINDLYNARNAPDYAAYRRHTCAADLANPAFPTEQAFLAENKRSLATNGRIVIPEITDLNVSGDRATARVHWHFDNKPDQVQVTPTVVVREVDEWKVCAS